MTRGRLRVAIAGYGVVGQRRHTFIDACEHLHTVAVCDQRFASGAESAKGVTCYSSFQELLKEDLDILFVCLPNDMAPVVTVAGLEAGLHVFCEKPPGRSVADIKQVRSVESQRPKQKLMYGFNHRYHDSVQDALAVIRDGNFGKILNMRGVYGKSQFISFGEASNWRTQRAMAGGGILLDQGIHMLDLMRLFAGDFTEIHSFVSNDYWHYDVEDNAYALMRSANGAVAMLHSTATQWRHRFSLDVTLERGGLVLSGILSGSKSYGAETLTVVHPSEDDVGDPRETTTRYNTDPSWQAEIEEFVSCIVDNRQVVNGSSEDALKVMEMVYRIYCADPAWKARWKLDSN